MHRKEHICRHSLGTPLHLIVITDSDSRPAVTATIKRAVGSFLATSVIKNHYRLKQKFPVLAVEYVDIESITNRYRKQIDFLKKHFGYHHPEGTYVMPVDGEGEQFVAVPNLKYTRDLFYIAPFYHKEMPEEIKKLIVLDIDLEFRFGIKT